MRKDVLYDKRLLKVKVVGKKGDNYKVELPIKVIREIIFENGTIPINKEDIYGIDINKLVDKIIESINNEKIGEIIDECSNFGEGINIIVE